MLLADVESNYIWDYFQPEKFRDIDIMISCGDVKAEYLSFLVTMIKAPLFYVPGNHNDKYRTLPPEGCIDIDGKIITYKGIRIMGLGGSRRYNMGHYQYTEKQMGKRIFKMKPKLWRSKGIDILVTHSPAFGIGDGDDLCHTGFKAFYKVLDKYLPKYFVHGHQHLSYGYNIDRVTKYKETTIINGYDYYIFEY
jgi:Icc-related predicted phosphoesterase